MERHVDGIIVRESSTLQVTASNGGPSFSTNVVVSQLVGSDFPVGGWSAMAVEGGDEFILFLLREGEHYCG